MNNSSTHKSVIQLEKTERKELDKISADFKRQRRIIEKISNSPAPAGNKLKRKLLIGLISLNILALILPPFYYPVQGAVTSAYSIRKLPEGTRGVPLFKRLEIHNGIDIAARQGSRISSSSPGIVHAAETSPTYGNYVEIYHLFGFSTRYAHLESLSVSPGKLTIPGLTKIGTSGSSGRSTGSHLHFEVRFLDIPIPPGIVLFYHRIRRKILGF